MKKLSQNKKGNMGGVIFLLVILFNIFMYIVLRTAHADTLLTDPLGDYSKAETKIDATTGEELSTIDALSWYDGFDVSVFNMPWWVSIFYVTFQGVLISLSIYMLIRGLS